MWVLRGGGAGEDCGARGAERGERGVMEYCIVSAADHAAIERRVCELMQEGWTPQGGVCVALNKWQALRYVQAMVRTQPAAPFSHWAAVPVSDEAKL